MKLADQVGISRRTLVSAEHGQTPTLETYLSIFRGLNLLDRFQLLLPEPALSPIQLAKLIGRERKNASQKRKPTTSKPWAWNPSPP